MEYFLPLSVMAMIISSISIFLIDNQNPKSNTDPENDQSTSTPSERLEEDHVDEFTISENKENPQKSVSPNDISDDRSLRKIQSTETNLKAFQKTFSTLWNTRQKSIFSTNKS